MTFRSFPRARAGAVLAALALLAAPAAAAPGGKHGSDKQAGGKHARGKHAGGKHASPGSGKGNEAQAVAPAPVAGQGKGKKTGKAKGHAASGSPGTSPSPPPLAPVATPTPTAVTAPPAAEPEAKPRRRTEAKPKRRKSPSRGGTLPARSTGPTPFAVRSPAVLPRALENRPKPNRAPARRERSKDDGGSPIAPVTRTVRDIVEVVPEPVKMLLAAMALLTVVLGGGYGLTAARARRLTRQRSDLLQEVGLLQTALLPPVPAVVGAVRTSVAYRPSDGPGAGGDFYDAMTLPGGRAAFILGDVSGHGRAALARTAFMRYTLRAYLEAGLDPRTTLQVAGRVIDEHLGGDFATVLLAVHDPRSGSLTYACAGHPAPIVVGPCRHEPVFAASSPPIGLGMRTGLRQTTLPLPPGSVVCLYTDGLAEARTERSILGRPRLSDIVAELGRTATAQGLLDRVAHEARAVTDDMATIVLTPTAGMTAGGFRSEQLEIDAQEARGGLAKQFLAACGVGDDEAAEAAAEVVRFADSHGGAVLHVGHGIRGPRVEVLPRNVESLEAASRRAAAAAG